MADGTQDDSFGTVVTAFGADAFLLESFSATERFSHPFTIEVNALSEDAALDFIPQLGTGVSLEVDGDDDVARFFHGVLFEARQNGFSGGNARYTMVLKPWISLLGIGKNTKIFQKKTAKAIIEAVFQAAGFSDYQISTTSRGTNVREYCVQYRETDLDFVSRLMEEEGIYYFFTHTQNAHTMVLCDDPSCHTDYAGGAVDLLHGEAGGTTGRHLWSWGQEVRPSISAVSLRDTHFRKPSQTLDAQSSGAGASAAELPHYDFPGGYGYIADDGSTDGGNSAENLLQASRAERVRFTGEGDVFAVPVGSRLKVSEGDAGEVQYLVVGASYTFTGQAFSSGDDQGGGRVGISIQAVPVDVNWRPERLTPKPLVWGPQTATVVGASGEVIDVDAYGRIKVQFPWDRDGTNDENSSCWVRVAQSSADASFGHMHIPRIGEEVLVNFLDGDPDRPIVTGRVYNSDKMPPYTLPDDKTKSTWKSQTIGDAGAYDEAEEAPTGKGFNEIRFEDKGGSEEVFVHAQRVFNAWYRLDEQRKTGRDTTVRVGRNRETNIKKNETTTVETGDETRTISQGSRTTKIYKDESLTLDTGDETRTITAGSRTTEINKDDTSTIQTGDYSLTVSAGQATIDAAQKITLKVGDNQIIISQQGVEIKGLTFKTTAETSLAMQGLTSDFKASTNLTINGLMVQIN